MSEYTVLAATVGGSSNPVAYAIANCDPAPSFVLFFVSKESKGKVANSTDREPSILELAAGKGRQLTKEQYQIIEVPHQDLNKAVDQMRRTLKEQLDKHPCARLYLDFTAGTKCMSAALAIAGERLHGATYSYIGAQEGLASRDKDGLGVTQTGRERFIQYSNPRDVSTYSTIQDALLVMDQNAWGTAHRLLEQGCKLITDPERRRELKAFMHLAAGYDAWEAFDYSEAKKRLSQAMEQHKYLAAHLPAAVAECLGPRLKTHIDLLENLETNKNSRTSNADLMAGDLVANAKRRAAEARWSEAILRLYRVLELLANAELVRLRLVGPNGQPDQVPINRLGGLVPQSGFRRGEYWRRLALFDKWRILASTKNSPIAKRYQDLNLASEMESRHNFILIHGYEVAEKKTYINFLEKVLKLLGKPVTSDIEFPTFGTGDAGNQQAKVSSP